MTKKIEYGNNLIDYDIVGVKRGIMLDEDF